MSDEQSESPPRGFAGVDVAPDENYYEGGSSADHEWGVQYQGPFEALDDGASRAVRLHARALAGAGMPVLLQSFTNTFRGPDGAVIGAEATDPVVKAETHALRHASIKELRVRVKHIVVHSAEQLRASIIPNSIAIEQNLERAMELREMLYRTTVVYSVWERTTIDDAVAAILRRVGECWVPCEQNKRLLEHHGIERVTVVPHPWEKTSPLARLIERAPHRVPLFYAIGLWQPRKGFHELLGAFLGAFQPGAAHLTIKHRATRFPGYPEPRESVTHWLAQPEVQKNGWTAENVGRGLWLPGAHWSNDEVTRLHFDSNIYVSSSRGEAFNFGAFDAKVSGNRMVHIPFGGTADFASPGDIAVAYELEPVPSEYQWEPEAKWASVSVGALSEALRRAAPPEAFVRDWGAERFEMQAVGKLMRERVERLVSADRR
jgi:hypothetical protein